MALVTNSYETAECPTSNVQCPTSRSVIGHSTLDICLSYGEGGIRTPDRGISPYNGLANRRLQPLGHLSTARGSLRASVDGHKPRWLASHPHPATFLITHHLGSNTTSRGRRRNPGAPLTPATMLRDRHNCLGRRAP